MHKECMVHESRRPDIEKKTAKKEMNNQQKLDVKRNEILFFFFYNFSMIIN